MTASTSVRPSPSGDVTNGVKPMFSGKQTRGMVIAVQIFVWGPLLAFIAGVVLLCVMGAGLTKLTIVNALVGMAFYYISGMGVTAGFHRLFTHRSYRAKRGLKIALAVCGSLAIQGSIIQWVADHRRHHENSDDTDDPHSPWRYGTGLVALTKGMIFAHVGWLWERELTNMQRYAPKELEDADLRRVDELFLLWVLISVAAPPVIVGLVTWSWTGALWGLLWASLIRIALLHHVTWSINSICHVIGTRPFKAASDKDRASNVWMLALPSFGESFHNMHHAEPSSARHGVGKFEPDTTAGLIRLFEKLGWATNVHWPSAKRIAWLRTRRSD